MKKNDTPTKRLIVVIAVFFSLMIAFTAVLGIVGIKYQEKMMAFCKRIGRRIKGGEHEEKNL